MKHNIVARDKKTGQVRHFIFDGDFSVGPLLVEEIAEKPVQEKPSFGTSGNDMGYPTAVFGDAPVQEKTEDVRRAFHRPATPVQEGIAGHTRYDVSATPDAGGWEAEWDKKITSYDKDGGFIHYVEGYDCTDFDVELIKGYVSNLLASEREKLVNAEITHYAGREAQAIEVGAKAERQRISEGVGKLKNDDDGKHPQIYDEPCEDWVENWMIERVLKVVRGEEIKS